MGIGELTGMRMGMKPMEPVSGVGKGGRLGQSGDTGFVQSMFGKVGEREDPREALLKYADKKGEEEGQ